jgi:hypothetical protein
MGPRLNRNELNRVDTTSLAMAISALRTPNRIGRYCQVEWDGKNIFSKSGKYFVVLSKFHHSYTFSQNIFLVNEFMSLRLDHWYTLREFASRRDEESDGSTLEPKPPEQYTVSDTERRGTMYDWWNLFR